MLWQGCTSFGALDAERAAVAGTIEVVVWVQCCRNYDRRPWCLLLFACLSNEGLFVVVVVFESGAHKI